MILLAAVLFLISPCYTFGQVTETIYDGSLENGWMDGSWAADNLQNSNPTLAGFSNSISVACTMYSALYLYQTPASSANFSSLVFYVNGGPEGGQVLTVYGTLDQVPQTPYVLPPLVANQWTQYTIPLSALGVADEPDFDGIWIYNNSSSAIPTFYADDIYLTVALPAPPPPPPPPPAPNFVFVYSNSLLNGWTDQSYNCTRSFSSTALVHPGDQYSISATVTQAYGGIQLEVYPPVVDTNYSSITFWLNGGPTGGQNLQMYGILDTPNPIQPSRYYLALPQANTWQKYTVPLYSLGVNDVTNFTGFAIQDAAGGSEPTFYLDDIELEGAIVPPSVVLLSANAGQPIRTADARWFGINTPIWDSILDTPQSIALLTNMGVHAIRIPGGSDSDDYHWIYNRQDQNTWSWYTGPGNFVHVITNVGAQAMTTLNYGTGSSNEAAAWVAYCNAATSSTVALGTDTNGFNWQTAGYWASLRAAAPLAHDDGRNFLRIQSPSPVGFKYWEIGNEVYGSWETDSNAVPHDPYTYAMRAKGYIGLMKGVDPTVKIGVVVSPGANSYVNNMNHPAVDPVTHQTNYGWTPVLLATLKSLGVTPDFAIFHNYPQNPGGESDAGLLGTTTQWTSAATDLRGQINDYIGSPNATNIELLCTENNSVSSAPGKQSTSLVNGLYKIDSLAQLMQTEFNGLFWWAFRNGVETDGNMSANLYGWRDYGDYGVVDYSFTNIYPTYDTSELTEEFVAAGDTVITASSDYSLLSTYAVQRQDGRLTVLTINKDPVNTITGQVWVQNYTPGPVVNVYTYGRPQDDAVENGTGATNISESVTYISSTNFNYNFAPYSATVMVLTPPGPSIQPVSHSGNQMVVQLQGTPGVPYVLESSTNLLNWAPVSTNRLTSNKMNVTNTVVTGPSQRYWRAAWQP